MKKLRKLFFLVAAIVIAAALFAACGPEPEPGPGPGPGPGPEVITGAASAGEITGVYSSTTTLTYSNMRPTYNYYTTTLSFQQIVTYDDGTYCLMHVSTAHSAVEIAFDGGYFEGSKSNPGNTSIKKHYGTFTSATEDETLILTLSKPFRITYNFFSRDASAGTTDQYVLDSGSWTAAMGERAYLIPAAAARNDDDKTAAGFLKRHGFNEATVPVNALTGIYDTRLTTGVTGVVTGTNYDNYTAPTVPALMDVPTSPAYAKVNYSLMGRVPVLQYSGTGDEDDDYLIGYEIYILTAYSDGGYNLSITSIQMKNYSIADVGNTWSGSFDSASTISYYGNDFVTKALGENSTELTLSKALRIVDYGTKTNSSTHFNDTENWTGSGTAEAFLEANAFSEKTLVVVLSTDYFEIDGFNYTIST